MNLAHVERYFADMLSGMESMQPCLPNLSFQNGSWRMHPSKEEKLPYPRNLFIVGTVNVDETTYMFSPKVLDRANTLEFRVGTSDLLEDFVELQKMTIGIYSILRHTWILSWSTFERSIICFQRGALNLDTGCSMRQCGLRRC